MCFKAVLICVILSDCPEDTWTKIARTIRNFLTIIPKTAFFLFSQSKERSTFPMQLLCVVQQCGGVSKFLNRFPFTAGTMDSSLTANTGYINVLCSN